MRAQESGATETTSYYKGRAKTSDAGIVRDPPASKRAMRRAISASHAASAPSSGSGSTLTKRRYAKATRWSGGSTRASCERMSNAVGISGQYEKNQCVSNPKTQFGKSRLLTTPGVLFRSHCLNFQFTYWIKEATSAFSSFSSLTVASILARLNSLTGTPWTISHFLPSVRMGNELMMPFSTP